MTTEEKKSWAVELLREKHKELNRLPHKDDFDEVTRSRIKAFLGPWPRALEMAGLKEAKENYAEDLDSYETYIQNELEVQANDYADEEVWVLSAIYGW